MKLVQCVPNFSEGRDSVILNNIANVISKSQVRLIDKSADPDHNRSVFTFVGSPEDVLVAAVEAARESTRLIDLRGHVGVHPRLGALDVLPFVPLRDITLTECAVLARRAGAVLSEELKLPVFFYDAASDIGRPLPSVRKGAFRDIFPDMGPATPHSSAGAITIGARGPLVAFNVNLNSSSLPESKQIAQQVRKHFAGSVRALGLELPSRRIFQVSMNIIHPERVDLVEVLNYIAERGDVWETELIGAMPGFSAFAVIQSSLKLRHIQPGQVLLENWPNKEIERTE